MASVNKKLTKADVVLGGKIRCEGCGGEWWLSGPQAEAFLEKQEWPHVCGNNKAIDVPGTREDCEDETEMVFLPYDIDENIAVFRADGQNDVADQIRMQCAKLFRDRAGVEPAIAAERAGLDEKEKKEFLGGEV